MRYYVFDNEAEAVAVEQQICGNVLLWCAANAPDALSEDRTKLRMLNAATGEWEEGLFTQRWDTPRQIQDGRYVVCKPYEPAVAPVPLDVVLTDIVADEADEAPEWWTPMEL